jgi:hypothetical protein
MQETLLKKNPFNLPEIVDIASYVREFGSGRELPRHIIGTSLGEVDFGLTSKIMGKDKKGNILVKLLPYNLQYYKEIRPNFRFPDDVEIDQEGHPIVAVKGLKINRGCDMIF